MDAPEFLERFQPETQAEAKTKAAVLQDWYRRGEALLYRDCDCHFTASAMVFDESLTQVLLVHHNLYHTFAWPGGHADGSGDFLKEALREVQEETGLSSVEPWTARILSLDILPVPEQEKNSKIVPAHTHYSVGFGFVASTALPLRIKADENSAVQWLPFSEIEAYSGEPHMIRIYKRIHKKMRALKKEKAARFPLLPERLLPWYRKNARDLPWRQDREPYHVWLSEIMLQQTRVEAVKGYYARFLETFPTVEALAAGEEAVLLKLWEGLGYYNRARNLQKAAIVIRDSYDGVFPQTHKELLALPGVGAYTAGAVGSICFDLPTPAVDGNVLRVITRLTEDFRVIDSPALKQSITDALAEVYPTGYCGDFTQSLMELGATVCLPNGQPKCESCPLADCCMANAAGSWPLLPVKKKKQKRRMEEKTVFVLSCGDCIAVEKRMEPGVLNGLWQLPNVPSHPEPDAIAEILNDWGISDFDLERSVERKHIFTHIEWHMIGYRILCRELPERFRWVTAEQLETEISLPTAFRLFLDPLGNS